ncbi:MAG: hypothetical protein JSW52_06730, partial [Candidatus Coatesbacteria bacterium]
MGNENKRPGFWTRLKWWFTGGSPWPKPKNTTELADRIIETESRGFDIGGLWEDYKKAVELECAKGITSCNKAYYITKVFSYLSRMNRMYNYSRRASMIGILLVFIILYIMIIFISYFINRQDDVIFGIPVILIIWGLVGSISSVLISGYYKVKSKVLEYLDLIGYLYRFLLAVVLTAITFYIIQLGMVSLPGDVGTDIDAALERHEAGKKFREAIRNEKLLKPKVEEYCGIIADFNEAAKGKVEGKKDVLLKYSREWEHFQLECSMETGEREGEVITATISANGVRADWDLYQNKKAKLDKKYEIYIPPLRDKIKRVYGAESEEFRSIEDALEELEGDTEARLILLSENDDMWAPITLKLKSGRRIKLEDGHDLTVEVIQKYEKDYARELGKESRNLGCQFETVKDKLTSEAELANEELADAEKNVRKWSAYFPSYEISQDIERLEGELNEDINRLKEATTDEEKDVIQLSIGEIEAQIATLRVRLKDAYKEESGKPIWESAIFIVIAFLAGYSTEFTTRLINQLLKTIAPKEEEP